MSRTLVSKFRTVIDTHHNEYSAILYDADLKLIERIPSQNVELLLSLRTLLQREHPLYWDSGRQWLVTGEFEPVGEGDEVGSPSTETPTLQDQKTSVTNSGIPRHLFQAQVIDPQQLENERELLRQAFPDECDRYRHVSQYKVRFDVSGSEHQIFLYDDGKLKARVSTECHRLFDLILDLLRNGGETVLWDHYTGVLISELEPVGG